MKKHGGQRTGAGRPTGSGKFGEPTKAIRIPASQVESVMQWVQHNCYRLPFYDCAVAAGFPSPADGEMEEKLDLNDLLVKHPAATFFVRVSGLSMIKAGIHHNDILVVDRSLEPAHGKIVIAAVNGELTVKRLSIEGKNIRLLAENDVYRPIEITEGIELHIWGVVTSVIHTV
jgi:DNA polymerase V